MSVLAGVEFELKEMPRALREGALAQGALAVARAMDDFETGPAEMASCFRALQAALAQLRGLAPPRKETDGLSEIAEQRAKRRARVAGAADQAGS